jgi:hypothetical protein
MDYAYWISQYPMPPGYPTPGYPWSPGYPFYPMTPGYPYSPWRRQRRYNRYPYRYPYWGPRSYGWGESSGSF